MIVYFTDDELGFLQDFLKEMDEDSRRGLPLKQNRFYLSCTAKIYNASCQEKLLSLQEELKIQKRSGGSPSPVNN